MDVNLISKMSSSHKRYLYFGESPTIPPDSILVLSNRFAQDKRKRKIDLGVGYFYEDDGEIFIPSAVREAWQRVFKKSLDDVLYLSPNGRQEWLGYRPFLRGTARLVFGQKIAAELIASGKLVAVGTEGGTGAVSLAAEAFVVATPGRQILLGTPSWSPHLKIYEFRKLEIVQFHHSVNQLFNLDGYLEAIKQAKPNAIVLFHTVGHNPTGIDPTLPEWKILASEMAKKGNIGAFFDTPYAGVCRGPYLDTEPIRIFYQSGVPLAVSVSFAKTGGLYKFRPGVLLVPARNFREALNWQRLLNQIVRIHTSVPSAMGEELMGEVLSDRTLFAQWKKDLATGPAMLLVKRRKMLAELLPQLSYVVKQVGMYSTLTVPSGFAEKIWRTEAVNMTSSGRINFGGLLTQFIPLFAEKFRKILKSF